MWSIFSWIEMHGILEKNWGSQEGKDLRWLGGK
jgi:hypothetical protein